MNNPNNQTTEKINQTEKLITDAKLALKSWAKQIGEYHKTLKNLSNQLVTLKEQLDMKENNNNNKTLGGNN